MGIELTFREKASENGIMEFEDFRDGIVRDLSGICGAEFRVDTRDVMKNNGVLLHGISITGPDEAVVPTIYLESLYEEHKKGELNIKEASNRLLSIYAKERHGSGLNMYFLTEYEKVKDKIIFRLINAERNREFLKGIPHRSFLDLAVTYTVFIDDILPTAGNVTVSHELMKNWGIDENELFSLAMINTPRIKKPVIKELSDMLLELLGDDDRRIPGMEEQIYGAGEIRMFVLTNSDRYYGDSSILYPELLKELQHNMKTDLYLLPSSVHEFIIVPDTGGIREKELSELVRSVNETSVGEEDYLSDSVYLYKDHEIQICS